MRHDASASRQSHVVQPTASRALDRRLDQAAPHPAVDLAHLRPRHDERPQRARRCRDHRRALAHLDDLRLVAEQADRRTHPLEPAAQVARRAQARLLDEAPSKRAPDLAASRFGPRTHGKRVYKQADKLVIRTLRKLDLRRLGRRGVDVCGPAGAGAGATGSALGAAHEQARVDEAVEPPPRDVSVHGLGTGELVGAHRPAPPADKPQRLTQLRYTNCLQPVHLLYSKVPQMVERRSRA